ncbi:MAG TPA: 5'/3'-nucleotidase SurE [Candidatus Ozemobacteraceae bacterium]|nr:5'/3'-nucleotidase SurE [Candidatus Ozemobacteraceae bacterium]
MTRSRLFVALLLLVAFALPAQAEKPFRILVSDDDGIMSEGILELVKALEEVGSVTVCAPAENQSAMGHALTTDGPIQVEEVEREGKFFGYAIKGTPATSVKAGIIGGLVPETPDLVVSGINEGFNIGRIVYVSGTFNAAQEGVLSGIPGIAVSIERSKDMDYRMAAEFTRDLVNVLKMKGFPKDAVINVNVPACKREELKGVAVTHLSEFQYREQWVKRKTPWGKTYFWTSVKRPPSIPVEGSDYWAMEENYISVTPVPFIKGAPHAAKELTRLELTFDGKLMK